MIVFRISMFIHNTHLLPLYCKSIYFHFCAWDNVRNNIATVFAVIELKMQHVYDSPFKRMNHATAGKIWLNLDATLFLFKNNPCCIYAIPLLK